MKNWWYYYKWYVICGTGLVILALYLAGNALGVFRKAPDLSIAYIGETELPQDTVRALEQAFASISGDFNSDGEAIVKIRQYVSDNQNPEAVYYEYASEIGLIGDITDCESYIFLMDNPQAFQKSFHVLAAPDGSCPDELDFSTEGKAIAWKDCPVLAGLELGTYSVTILGQETSGQNQDLLSDLYIGRRCFYTKDTVSCLNQCNDLWNLLLSDAAVDLSSIQTGIKTVQTTQSFARKENDT